MKKSIILIFLIISCLSKSYSKLNFISDYAIFNLINEKAYVEFYLSLNGSSITYAEVDSNLFQARIEVTYIIEKKSDSSIVNFDKYEIKSPIYSLEDVKLDLLDLKRLAVPNGDYNYTLRVTDLITKETREFTEPLRAVAFKKKELTLSDIQLSSKVVAATNQSFFEKQGYDIIPSFTKYFDEGNDKLFFYQEIYNTDKALGPDQAFLYEYAIETIESQTVIANLRAFKKLEAQPIIPVIQSFNTQDLPTGKYHLVIKVKNRENEELASKKIKFYRNNPTLVDYSSVLSENTFVDSLNNKEELAEYIKSLQPISDYSEIQFAKNQLQYADLKFMQQYFLNFWRNRNMENPELEWLKYKEQVLKADQLFGYGNIKGYQTERGRVYLQYGPPDVMQNQPREGNTLPYSVWQYYKLNKRVNQRFIFYSPSLEMLGYELLHSTVRGEINNPNWAQVLAAPDGPYNTTQDNPFNRTIQEDAEDLFNNPR